MDRRKALRYSVSEPVRVKSSTASRDLAAGRIQDISDEGMRLALTASFPPGSILELECADWVLRGSVVYSRFLADGPLPSYVIGIKMEQFAKGGAQEGFETPVKQGGSPDKTAEPPQTPKTT